MRHRWTTAGQPGGTQKTKVRKVFEARHLRTSALYGARIVKKDPHHQQIVQSQGPKQPSVGGNTISIEQEATEITEEEKAKLFLSGLCCLCDLLFKNLGPSCRGSFPPQVKKDPHHRRGSIFRSRRGSYPHRTDADRRRLRARDSLAPNSLCTRQPPHQTMGPAIGNAICRRALRISLASQHDAYFQPTAKSGRRRARVSMAV
jgi:hypothetical protein